VKTTILVEMMNCFDTDFETVIEFLCEEEEKYGFL